MIDQVIQHWLGQSCGYLDTSHTLHIGYETHGRAVSQCMSYSFIFEINRHQHLNMSALSGTHGSGGQQITKTIKNARMVC